MKFPELPLEPPAPVDTGAYYCDCCGENIPADDEYVDILGQKFCMCCIDLFKKTAPSKEEVRD